MEKFPAGATRTCGVEDVLTCHRSSSIQQICKDLDNIVSSSDYDGANLNNTLGKLVTIVFGSADIKHTKEVQLLNSLFNCCTQIWSYKRLLYDVKLLTDIIIDEKLLAGKLKARWDALVYVKVNPLVSPSTHRKEISFHSDDPKTDSRRMGVLPHDNLSAFIQNFSKEANHIHSHFYCLGDGLLLATLSTKVTKMALDLLNDGSAKPYMYNISKDASDQHHPIELKHFHNFYSYLFVELDKFWFEQQPDSLVEFEFSFSLFENRLRSALSDYNMCPTIKSVRESGAYVSDWITV